MHLISRLALGESSAYPDKKKLLNDPIIKHKSEVPALPRQTYAREAALNFTQVLWATEAA